MRNAVVNRLFELAEKDDRIFLVTGDLGFGVLTDFAEKFPRQFLNAGVAEQNMTALAAGLALEGYVVFTYSIGNFPILRCLEQIRNDICYHDAPVKIVSVGAGFSYGPLGMSHHATEDLAILRALPNMLVSCPSDPYQAAFIVDELIQHPGPCYLRIDKSCADAPPQNREAFTFGAARQIREGSDLTLIASGGILKEAILAAEHLARQNIRARVLDVHCLKPLDGESVRRAAETTGGIITIEEHSVIGGLGGAVAEFCMESGVHPGFFSRIGLKDTYSSLVGSQTYLRQCYGLDASAIVKVAERHLGRGIVQESVSLESGR